MLWEGWKEWFKCAGPFHLNTSVGVARKARSKLYHGWSNCLHLLCIFIKLKSLKLSSKRVVTELSSSIFGEDMKKNFRLSKSKERKKYELEVLKKEVLSKKMSKTCKIQWNWKILFSTPQKMIRHACPNSWWQRNKMNMLT